MSAREISIPEDIYGWIKGRLSETQFNTVEEYVIAMLEEAKNQLGGGGDSGIDSGDDSPAMSREEEDKVKERLRALGYLD